MVATPIGAGKMLDVFVVAWKKREYEDSGIPKNDELISKLRGQTRTSLC